MTTRRRAPFVGHRRGVVFAAVLAASASAAALPVGALTATAVDASLVPPAPLVDDSTLTVDPVTGEVAAEPGEALDDPLAVLTGTVEGVVDGLPLPEEDAPPADEGETAPPPPPGSSTGGGDRSGATPDEVPLTSSPSSTPDAAVTEDRTSSSSAVVPAAGGVVPLRPSTTASSSGSASAEVPVAGGLVPQDGGAPRSLAFRPDAGHTAEPRAKAGPDQPSALRSTAPILDLLGGLELTPAQLAKVLAPFPVAGRASYSDDWGHLRHGPGPLLRSHEGTDIFAAAGTPVIASTSGVVGDLRRESGLGGTSLRLTGPDGTEYFYAHLADFHDAVADGGRVSKGQVLGFVGSTGNASATSPHLHFEIHPRGGAAVPPVPFLDRWLAEAMATARTLERAPDGTVSMQVAGARRPLVAAAASPSPVRRAAVSSTASGAVHRMANAASTATEAAPWGGVLVAGGLLAWFGWKLPASRRRRPATAPAANEPVGGLLDLG